MLRPETMKEENDVIDEEINFEMDEENNFNLEFEESENKSVELYYYIYVAISRQSTFLSMAWSSISLEPRVNK